jgi:hypothetical protein
LRTIARFNEAAVDAGLSFVVIGAHAVAAHGFARATSDFDVLTSRKQREDWLKVMTNLGYSQFHDGGNFLQFTSSTANEWNIDLMLTDESTFTKIVTSAQKATIGGSVVRIPTLDHLIALKLHALKFGRTSRFLKDLDDVINLIVANKVDVHGADFKQLVEQFGTTDLYEQLVRLSRR